MADRFGWADEPELLDVRDANRSRKALDALGEAVWREAIDWFYDEAMRWWALTACSCRTPARNWARARWSHTIPRGGNFEF